MTRIARLAAVIALVLVAGATSGCVFLLLLRGGPMGADRESGSATGWWTDGRSVQVDAGTIHPRRVLWEPAAPLHLEEQKEPATADRPAMAAASEPTSTTRADEYEPRIVAADSTMLLVRGRPGANCDLWIARRTAGGWTTPQPLTAANTDADELGPELSADGTRLFFCSDRDGGLGGYDLWMMRRVGAGAGLEGEWSSPINLGPAINSPANEYGPALTPDGARLYFASNRPRPDEPDEPAAGAGWRATVRERRTRHDYDLYAATLDDDSGHPTGPHAAPLATLNTAADEGTPAVSPAGDFLWFTSDRPGGRGGLDLFRARLGPPRPHGDLADGVGPAEALDGALNSAWHDLDPALAADGFRVVFSSDRPQDDAALDARADGAADGRYSLWSSVSREVWLESRPGPSLAQLVAQLVAEHVAPLLPWLLLLLLAGLLLWLLSRLLGRADLRARLARLSLLVQCLLASLLLHGMLAALLAAWHVGTGLESMLQSPGGTRVVLEGASADSDAIDGLSAQVRGDFTSIDLESLTPELSAAPPLPSTDASTLPLATVPPTVALAPASPTQAIGAERLAAPLPAPAPSQAAAPTLPRSTTPQAPASEAVMPTLAAETGTLPAILESPVTIEVEAHLEPAARSASADAAREMSEQAGALADDLRRVAPSSAAVALPEAPKPPAASAQPESAATEVAQAGTALLVPPLPGPRGEVRAPSTPDTPAMLVAAAPARAERSLQSVDVPLPQRPDRHAAPMGLPTPQAPPSTRADPAPPALAAATVPPAIPQLTVPPAVGHGPLGIPTPPVAATAPPVHMEMAVPAPSASRRAAEGALAASPRGNASGPARGANAATDAPRRTVAGPRLPDVPADVETPVPVETFAQRDPESRAKVLERMGGSASTERAVAKALEWFARHQSADGRWSALAFDHGPASHGGGPGACGCDHPAEVHMDLATTSLALLCFLGAGHTQVEEGPYRSTVEGALAWIVGRQRRDGDLRHGRDPAARPEESDTMYGQTIAAVALCEAYAMTSDRRLAEAASNAVRFVIDRTEASRRQRTAPEDTAVLGWQLMVFASARRAGIEVPARAWGHARTWLETVAVPGAPGRYAYGRGGAASVAMTAEAMFVRQLLDELDGRTAEGARMEQSADFVATALPAWTDEAPTHHWYYATLALHQHQGDAWRRWNEALAPALVDRQIQEGCAAGSWTPQDEWSVLGGRLYQTAICTLSLEAYYRYRAGR